MFRGAKDLVSPSELLGRSIRQAGVSLTLGVFLGAAATAGATCGVIAFWLANESLLKRLRRNATDLVAATRDAVLSTQEGRALLDVLPKPQGLRGLVAGGRKAVCVGKNYREHITELAHLGPEWTLEEHPEPVLFLKPTTTYAWPGTPLVLPRQRLAGGDGGQHGIHHELELAVIIGERVRHCTDDAAAMRAVAGYVLALDITDRDAQTAAKVAGMPWTVSKGYDTFLPLSEPFTLDAAEEDWRELRLWLSVNGERRQACQAGTMLHGVPALVRYVSSIMTLEPGDLIVTGTPAGVGAVVPGDTITAGVVGKVEMTVEVVRSAQ